MRVLIIITGLMMAGSCRGLDPKTIDHRIMFYNLENLFYPEDDPLTSDDEFTPDGIRHWTMYRYHKKITAVVKVIIAAGEGSPPEVIGLCEIENGRVLSDLVDHPLLMKYNYQYIHRDGPDPRGIDVALLYRPEFSIMDHNFHRILLEGSDDQTREILHVRGVLSDMDSVDFLVNHWTSRYGDAVSSSIRRLNQAEMLWHITDSLLSIRKDPLIISMGDFNEQQDSAPLEKIMEHRLTFLPDNIQMSGLIQGSYKYQGSWETIDHFVVTATGSKNKFSRMVFSLPQIVEPDEKYTGLRPSRTYIGYTYNGGVSDHLPVILMIGGKNHPDR